MSAGLKEIGNKFIDKVTGKNVECDRSRRDAMLAAGSATLGFLLGPSTAFAKGMSIGEMLRQEDKEGRILKAFEYIKLGGITQAATMLGVRNKKHTDLPNTMVGSEPLIFAMASPPYLIARALARAPVGSHITLQAESDGNFGYDSLEFGLRATCGRNWDTARLPLTTTIFANALLSENDFRSMSKEFGTTLSSENIVRFFKDEATLAQRTRILNTYILPHMAPLKAPTNLQDPSQQRLRNMYFALGALGQCETMLQMPNRASLTFANNNGLYVQLKRKLGGFPTYDRNLYNIE